METRRTRQPLASPPVVATAITVVVLAAAGAAWYFRASREAPPPAAAQAPAPAATPAPSAPAHYPVPEPPATAAASEPLPALDASDARLVHALANVLGPGVFDRFFRPEALVRRLVATIDNLPRASYAQRLSPVHPVGGLLVTQGAEASLALAPGNAARYAPWVRALDALDARRVVAVYARFYPLFQQAYVELGYPDGYFNDRLVQVIDHLLAFPVPTEPPRLVVRRVLPEFADPALEAQSAGRKILLRLGPGNAAVVKAKLRALRAELTQRTLAP